MKYYVRRNGDVEWTQIKFAEYCDALRYEAGVYEWTDHYERFKLELKAEDKEVISND